MAEKDFRVKRGIHVGTDAYISNSITSVNAISFATNANVDPVLGMLTWDETYQTLDVGLSDGLSAHLGQDSYYYVTNQSGSTLTKGTAVQAAGTLGASGTILVSKAIANGTVASKLFMGLVAEDIPDGGSGYVVEFGKLRQANTIAFSAGDILYVDPAVPGGLSNTLPVAPNNKVTVAFVINRSDNQGVLAVRPTFDTKLADLQDVYINGISDGQVIKWVSANSRFESATLTSTPSLNVALANSSNIATNVVSGVSTLLFDTDSGLDIVNLGGGNVKVQLNSTFKTWEVDGQESLIAEGLDNVRFVAGDGISITTNALASPKSISFGWNANSWVNANDYSTLLTAQANDYNSFTTLTANDYNTLLSARANDYNSFNTLTANIYNTYNTLNTNLLSAVEEDNSPILGGNLTLNSYSIIGTGDININGSLTADSANLSNFTISDTLTIGSQVIYAQGTNGFSVNEDFDPSNNALQTAYHFTSGAGRQTVAFTLARTGQFTDGFGIYGTAANNALVMFGEQTNTNFEWRKGIGIRPLDLDGGTQLMHLSSGGDLTVTGNLLSRDLSNAWVNANDYSTLLTARANDYNTLLTAYSNDYATILSAQSNDGATLLTARSNDYNTLLAAYANDYNSYTSLSANDYNSYTSLSANDYNSYTTLEANIFNTFAYLNANIGGGVDNNAWVNANDYTTYLAALSNDGATLATARGNDHNTLLSAYANDVTTLATARGNDHTTLLAAYANDATTLLSARANDHSTFTTLTANIFNTYTQLNANINVVQSNIGAGSNTNIYAGNVNLSNTTVFIQAGDGVVLTSNTVSKTLTIATSMSNVTSQTIAISGTSNSFTLTKGAANVNMILVMYNGLVQDPSNYVISGTTLSLLNTAPLIAGANIEVRYFDFFSMPGDTGGPPASTQAQGSTSGYTSGGNGSRNTIDKFPFASDGNASDVGDLTRQVNRPAGQSSTSHGYTSGGLNHSSSPIGVDNTIDKFPFAADGNATDVGDLTQSREQAAGQTSDSSGYTSAGFLQPFYYNTIDKFPFSTDANATDVGDLSQARTSSAGQSSESSGYTSGGFTGGSRVNTIDKFPFATNANASDVGDLTRLVQDPAGQNSVSHGYTSGGYNFSVSPLVIANIIDKFPFAADGNATDVGDLTVARRVPAGQSSVSSGYTSGGETPAYSNVIDKFSFSADANASDVGDLTAGRGGSTGQQV